MHSRDIVQEHHNAGARRSNWRNRGGRGRNRTAAIGVSALALMITSLGLASCASSRGGAATEPGVAAQTVRIGTYDSRAVALAFVRSDAFGASMKNLKQQHDNAVDLGQAHCAEELNKRGEAQQVRRKFQGFSTAPVDDILNTVRDELPGVAQRMNVAVITREADHHHASVEVIDVTDELVQLFHPDARTLKMIADMREQRPVPIEVIALNPKGG